MKIYLVGGAVRDKLLGIPVKEKDWVVVGATVDDMLKKGFKQVGKDFPVFLHPETQEEYALARTERKVGRGYTGFDFNAAPHVTLEDDLKRRDLTINAMAEAPDGSLIDPYHGQEDLNQKWLRHVSPAFVEDPVRILRIARFAARFPEFTVAPETNELMKQMVASGEVDALVPERVWKELERALSESHPEKFFQVLKECEALPKLFSGINENSLKTLMKAAQFSLDKQIRLAALTYDLPANELKFLCERFRIPSDYRELVLLVSRYYRQFLEKLDNPETVISLLQATDAFRREERFFKLLQLFEIIDDRFPMDSWRNYLKTAKTVDVKILIDMGFKAQALADEIKKARIKNLAICFKK